MKDRIQYGNSVIEYTVIKSKRRKTSEIRVDENGVEIRVPLIKKNSEIKNLIDDKKQWIYKKQLDFAKRSNDAVFLRKYSRSFVLKRVVHYSNMLQVKPNKIVFKKLRARWGSSTKDGIINFNVDLLKSPKGVIDYVVLHELCHLRIRAHSHKYWTLMHRLMPDYEYRKNWLETHGVKIL